jgi:PPK2 family polyphosphate:nucleotide phosphotransferase
MNVFKHCAVKPGDKIDLETIDAAETFGWRKGEARAKTAKNFERIAELQNMLYAEQKRSVLICLQAMDTGGKDGTVKTIGGAMNPAGVRVVSFKAPTAQERAHDFLWRIEKQAPKKPGEIAIFNRSQYEDVGIVRVHNLVPKKIWSKRFNTINDFEARLSQPGKAIPGGVTILKFFLHISPEEQLKRLEARLDDPTKHWKINESDFIERPYFHDYMTAFSDAINRCSTEEAPWFVIPADHKWMRDLLISQAIADTLENLKMKYPEPAVPAETIRQHYFDKDGLRAEFDVSTAQQTPSAKAIAGKPARKRTAGPKPAA